MRNRHRLQRAPLPLRPHTRHHVDNRRDVHRTPHIIRAETAAASLKLGQPSLLSSEHPRLRIGRIKQPPRMRRPRLQSRQRFHVLRRKNRRRRTRIRLPRTRRLNHGSRTFIRHRVRHIPRPDPGHGPVDSEQPNTRRRAFCRAEPLRPRVRPQHRQRRRLST